MHDQHTVRQQWGFFPISATFFLSSLRRLAAAHGKDQLTNASHKMCLPYIPVYTLTMTFLSKVSKALDTAGVRYALVGGYAVALHGAVRGTVDIDLVLRWTLRDLESAETALSSIGLVSRLPVTADSVFRFRDEYIVNRNLIAWNFYNPQDLSEQVDIVIIEDLKRKRRVRMDTRDGPVQVLSRKDLIAMKRASGRPQDLADVDALEKLP